MDIEICKLCHRVVATDCVGTGFYCAQLRDESPQWLECRHLPVTPEIVHAVAMDTCCYVGRRPPLKCPFRCEQAVSEGPWPE